jgi:MtfA peptidase
MTFRTIFLQSGQVEIFSAEIILMGILITFFLIAIIALYYYIKIRHYQHFFFVSHLMHLSDKFKKILVNKFSYYQKLCPQDKKKFEKRVQYFITTKKFIPRDMEEVTDEMKALIAASAVQLTFGFPGLNLAHFKKIIIYPEAYFSILNQAYHKGEVNPAGIIVLSWKSFKDGYAVDDDQKNLGLHEMAHALRLENRILNEEYEFFDKDTLEVWEKYSKEELINIRNGKESFFRRYAGTNSDEFFAVAVENFFERPQDFQNNLPDLYQVMVNLLKQDPLLLENGENETILQRN